MNFEQILELVNCQNKWQHINETNTYFHTDDIFLNFNLGEWQSITNDKLPENINRFRNILIEKFKVQEIKVSEVEFFYQKQLINKLKLYRFIGHKHGCEELTEELYFTELKNRHEREPVENLFSVSLIRTLNSKSGLNYIQYASGKDFK